MSETESLPLRYPENRSLEADLGSWWVLHVKPNCENRIAAYLHNREVGYYLPMIPVTEKYGGLGRLRTTVKPLFRGYVCMALEERRHDLLFDTKKIVKVIRVENQEEFVKEMEAVSKALAGPSDLLVQPGLVPGKRVVILSGPLQGAEGVVVRRGSGAKLAISVTMFNQTVLVKLDRETKVEPA